MPSVVCDSGTGTGVIDNTFLPPVERQSGRGRGDNNRKYLLLISAAYDTLGPGFPQCNPSGKAAVEAIISDDFVMSNDDPKRPVYVNDFRFYCVEGKPDAPEQGGCRFRSFPFSVLKRKYNGMAGFYSDGKSQFIVVPGHQIILPYTAAPMFPFREMAATKQRLDEMCKDPSLLFSVLMHILNKSPNTEFSKLERHAREIPATYSDYRIDRAHKPIPRP